MHTNSFSKFRRRDELRHAGPPSGVVFANRIDGPSTLLSRRDGISVIGECDTSLPFQFYCLDMTPFCFTRDPNLAEEDQRHFNPTAFRRPKPNGSVGNFGNAPLGVLRHPGWSNWDFTLARRIRFGGRANVRVRLQMYNLFNQVEFVTLNADYLFGVTSNTDPDTGKYTTTTNPRNVGLTLRFDF